MQRAGDGREDDVVDRSAQRVLDRLEVRNRCLGHREPSVRADRPVERALRRRSGGEDRAETGNRLAHLLQHDLRRADRECEVADRGTHRMRDLLAQRVKEQLARARRRLGPVGLRFHDARLRAEVEQDGRDVHAAHPVDHRMVHLVEDRHVPVLESFDVVDLPQRLRTVQRPRMDPLDVVGELLAPAGLRERAFPEMEVEIEVRVVHPHRPPRPEGHEHHLLAEARDQVLPLDEQLLHVVEQAVRAPGPRRRIEDRQARHVVVDARFLEEEELHVESGQALSHGDRPFRPSSGSPLRRSRTSPAWCRRLRRRLRSGSDARSRPAHARRDTPGCRGSGCARP